MPVVGGKFVISIVFVFCNQIMIWEKVLFECIEVKTLCACCKQIICLEIFLDLLLGKWQSFSHQVAVEEDLFRNKAETCKVQGSICIFCIFVHLVELVSESITNLTALYRLRDAISKKDVMIFPKLLTSFYMVS